MRSYVADIITVGESSCEKAEGRIMFT